MGGGTTSIMYKHIFLNLTAYILKCVVLSSRFSDGNLETKSENVGGNLTKRYSNNSMIELTN